MADKKSALTDDPAEREFRQLADSFIDVANRHCEKFQPPEVSSSFLFGASRFCSFVVAGKTGDLESYNQQKEAALDYYSKEFRSMLEKNLEDYQRVFKSDPDSE